MVCVTVAQTPRFLVTAPRLLHVGGKEDVWVQMEWPQGAEVPNNVAVEMYLRNQITFDECSEHYHLNLNTRNNHISKQTIELTPTRASSCKVENQKSSRYVQLVITSAALGKMQVVSIPISYKKGYIFIQTDKSVYTPKESVRVRMFTLDHMMRPTDESIKSTVINAAGLQVRTIQKLSPNSVVTDKFEIPDISITGVWRISAYYTSAPESNFTTEFEVKKYVLPNFEVKIIPELPCFQINKEQFSIKVEARYVYGEPVDGVVHVRVGIIDQAGKKTMLQGLEQQVQIKDAEGSVQINRDDILKKIAQPVENLVGSTFYIVATVLEKASGTLEEKELTSVKFVTSPYNLDFSKTRKYYTPGTPAQIVAEVTYTDGTPASGVTVQLLKANTQLSSFKSDEDGKVVFQINTDAKEKTLDLMVRTEESDGRQEERLVLTPYTSKTNSFLHMEVPIQVLSPGESIKVTVKVVTPHYERVQRVYYMVLNKGQILDLRFIEKSEFMAFSFPVSNKMVPSFRIIAYYYLDSEIVANSVWVDVSDVCEGKIQIRTDVKNSLLPGSQFKLTMETDEVTTVSLSAVDTAVYLVNSKGKLTPGKVFKAMNDYDLGCSPGGGKDSKSVFMDAGVAFVSSFGYSDLSELGCKVSQRKKRSIDFTALTRQKADNYSLELKKCCNNGIVLPPTHMERNCDIRAKRVKSEDCRKAFLDCCQYAEDLRKRITLEKRRNTNFGRTQGDDKDEKDFTDESEVQVRSNFPESWLWKTKKTFFDLIFSSETVPVPDSITTWEIQAVGMSTGKGFCVADPVKVKVFKPFHIHLRVPLTVKRFEQIELRPVLYNFENHDLRVRVFMDTTEGVCTPSTSDGGTKGKIVTVAKKSALSIPFSVVPIGKENPTITIMARGPVGVSDGVKKVLHIEREGVPVVDEKTYVLNPEDKTRSFLRIDQGLPSNMIPDGEPFSQVKATMDSPINTINNTLSSDGVSKLIRVPHGCAEQTMIATAPGVYAMRYLDRTNKWGTLPPDRRDQGLENMGNGYTRILQYRKQDGSYGAWLNRPSSTWLTSFVVKVMSLCRKYIDIDDEEIQKSVSYLITKQTKTGAFLETAPLIHKDMAGGVSGKNAEVSLTAYVLIALHYSKDALAEDDNKVTRSINKGLDYLRTALNSLSEPYPLAITTYALNLMSTNSKDQAYESLMSKAQKVYNPSQMYFGPKGTALAVETTSYALLTALLRNDIPNANLMYTWLTEQQNYGGGFKSTQDTVMALEALSEYCIQTSDDDRNELNFMLDSPGRSEKTNFTLRNQDFFQEELRSLGKTFTVKVSGKGTGILTVLKRYNIMKVEDSDCSQLGLEVLVHGDETEDEVDYGDYEDDEMADEPLGNIHWHDLRSRARREVSQPKEKSVKVVYMVSLWIKAEDRATGMAIVDITMLSGFEPSVQDLNKLKDGSERYISHYEIQGGRLLMYFDEVTSHKEVVTFEAFQTVKVSPLQPASAVLYDFYEPDNKCRVFYGAPSRTAFISTLCSNDVCQCAEGPCPTLKKTANIKEKDKRQQFACDTPRVMYGYHVKVLEMKTEDAFIVYKVQIIEVLRRNADENIETGDTRYFYQRTACKMRLQSGAKEYLIMGQDGQTEDEEKKMRYFLENNSWVEELASPQACKIAQDPNKCSYMNNFMNDYRDNGCKVYRTSKTSP
ncbi:PREDICTED: complement C4-like [Nanorana parkeri]|uniref:complement C4-like n=1 Tax=Nanorana parkeri TaxID=125878 RepID=UPI000854E48E|nr:PREDICTED: complement C4-like [Nanorana parkeri]